MALRSAGEDPSTSLRAGSRRRASQENGAIQLRQNCPVFHGVGQLAQALDGGRNLERRVFSGKFRLQPVETAWVRNAARLSSISSWLVEDYAELPRCAVSEGFESGQGCGVRNLSGEARHGPVGDAAGIDEAEIVEIGGDVEGKTMRGDAARDVNADGGNLALSPAWGSPLDECCGQSDIGLSSGCARRRARTRRRSVRRCVRRPRQIRRRAG